MFVSANNKLRYTVLLPFIDNLNWPINFRSLFSNAKQKVNNNPLQIYMDDVAKFSSMHYTIPIQCVWLNIRKLRSNLKRKI